MKIVLTDLSLNSMRRDDENMQKRSGKFLIDILVYIHSGVDSLQLTGNSSSRVHSTRFTQCTASSRYELSTD